MRGSDRKEGGRDEGARGGAGHRGHVIEGANGLGLCGTNGWRGNGGNRAVGWELCKKTQPPCGRVTGARVWRGVKKGRVDETPLDVKYEWGKLMQLWAHANRGAAE